MGRVLYDEFSKFEIVSSGKSVERLIKERWGEEVEVYASIEDHSRDVTVCWYHNPRYGKPRLSTITARDIKFYGAEPIIKE